MSFLPLKNCSNRRKKNCRLPEMLRSRPPLFHNYVCSRKLANDTLIGSSARQSRSDNRWGTKISTLSRYDCSQELEAASFSYCNFEREFESIIPPVKHCPPPSEHLFLRVLKQKEKKKNKQVACAVGPEVREGGSASEGEFILTRLSRCVFVDAFPQQIQQLRKRRKREEKQKQEEAKNTFSAWKLKKKKENTHIYI